MLRIPNEVKKLKPLLQKLTVSQQGNHHYLLPSSLQREHLWLFL